MCAPRRSPPPNHNTHHHHNHQTPTTPLHSKKLRTLVEKLIENIHSAIAVLDAHEQGALEHFTLLRRTFQSHRLPDNPARKDKGTKGVC